RPRHRVGARRHRHHLLVRGLAASLLRAARVAAAVETVVAALLGTVPLLSEPAPPARGAARVRRFHSSVSSGTRNDQFSIAARRLYLARADVDDAAGPVRSL